MWSPVWALRPLIVMLLVGIAHPPTEDGRRASPWGREMRGKGFTSQAQNAPGSGSGVEVEPGVDVVELEAAHLPDPLEPVAQGAPVDGEPVGRLVVVAAALEVGRQGLDQLRAVGGVVVEERAQPLPYETLHLGVVLAAGQDPVDPEAVMGRDPG